MACKYVTIKYGDLTNVIPYYVSLPLDNEGTYAPPKIKKVIFSGDKTIVLWNDATKTIVSVQQGDTFDPEKGLALAIVKKVYGNKSSYNNIFHKWVPKERTEDHEDSEQ